MLLCLPLQQIFCINDIADWKLELVYEKKETEYTTLTCVSWLRGHADYLQVHPLAEIDQSAMARASRIIHYPLITTTQHYMSSHFMFPLSNDNAQTNICHQIISIHYPFITLNQYLSPNVMFPLSLDNVKPIFVTNFYVSIIH